MRRDIAELLRRTSIVTAPGVYNLVSLTNELWHTVLQDPALSPRMTAPFFIFSDGCEVTLLLDELDFAGIRDAEGTAKTQGGFRLVSFDIELDFTVVGFLAEIARILADADIPILAISAFSRDHILVRQDHLARALETLSPFVDDLC